MYVKFDDPKTGYSLKDRRLDRELKECVTVLLEHRGSFKKYCYCGTKIISVNPWPCI